MAHKWARWLHNPYRLGSPHRFRPGGRIRSGPQVGKVATKLLPPRGAPTLMIGGQNQEVAHKWARWLHNPCRLGVPSASELEAEPEVAHKWARWLHNPYRLGSPHRFRPGGRIRSGPQVGKVATKLLPPRGAPTLPIGGQNQEVAHKWARWLHNPCRLGGPHRFRAGAILRVAHKWARWLHNPCRLGGPLRFRAGGRIRGGPQVGKVATEHLPPRGSPPLQTGGQNQKWPTSGQGGYITPAAWGYRKRLSK